MSSFVRRQLYDPEMWLNVNNITCYDPLPSPAAERALLGHVKALYQSRVLPAAMEELGDDQVC